MKLWFNNLHIIRVLLNF